MWLDNWDKGETYRAFPEINFIFQDTASILCSYCRKITFIHRRLYLELDSQIIPRLPLVIFSVNSK